MITRTKRLRIIGIFLGVLLLGCLTFFLAQRPSHDRQWQAGLDRLPAAQFTGDMANLTNVRNFRSQADGSRLVSWEDRDYDLSQVESLWYVLSLFNGDGWRGPAHGMLSFGFSDGRYLVVSVEARKEVGESYSIWKGMARQYELMYILGDERDMVLDRCAYRPDVVYLYPIAAESDQIRRLLEDFLNAANALHDHPRFYNTMTANCTSKLRDHVNEVFPGRIPPTWKVILPGYSDQLLIELNLLKETDDIEKVRQQYRIDEKGKLIGDDPSFSRLIRKPHLVSSSSFLIRLRIPSGLSPWAIDMSS